jgi:hypothetical protein
LLGGQAATEAFDGDDKSFVLALGDLAVFVVRLDVETDAASFDTSDARAENDTRAHGHGVEMANADGGADAAFSFIQKGLDGVAGGHFEQGDEVGRGQNAGVFASEKVKCHLGRDQNPVLPTCAGRNLLHKLNTSAGSKNPNGDCVRPRERDLRREYLILKSLFPVLIAAIALTSGACAHRRVAGAPELPNSGSTTGDQTLARYFDVSKRNVARGVTMAARFGASLPRMGKEAVLEARRTVMPDGAVQYDVLNRDGDRTVQKDVIARFMATEMDKAGSDNQDLAITTENYRFKFRGQQTREGHEVLVYDLNPRKKRVGLFKGELWLDAATGLPLRESGKLVKSPSVFLKDVEFARDYEIRDGRSYLKGMRTTTQTRFWGPAELEVEFTDLSWELPPVTGGRF